MLLKAFLRSIRMPFAETYSILIRRKAGLFVSKENDSHLFDQLFTLMQKSKTDYTLFFRRLCDYEPDGDNTLLRDLFVARDAFDQWCKDYEVRLSAESGSASERRRAMHQVNPKYVLRNYMAQIAIDQAEAGDYSEVDNLLALLSDPFAEWPEQEAYAGLPPDWGASLEVSCSS